MEKIVLRNGRNTVEDAEELLLDLPIGCKHGDTVGYADDQWEKNFFLLLARYLASTRCDKQTRLFFHENHYRRDNFVDTSL